MNNSAFLKTHGNKGKYRDINIRNKSNNNLRVLI